jgi:uncharacterized membrane protein HdeD (DUF308 family)
VTRSILIALYIIGAGLEVAGLFTTVEAFLKDNQDGTGEWVAPRGWRRARGPVLITLGIVVGIVGNIASLFPHS